MVNTHRVWSLRAGRPVMISTMMCSICQCCCWSTLIPASTS